jgi:uncharacterized protein (TIGR02145 family)
LTIVGVNIYIFPYCLFKTRMPVTLRNTPLRVLAPAGVKREGIDTRKAPKRLCLRQKEAKTIMLKNNMNIFTAKAWLTAFLLAISCGKTSPTGGNGSTETVTDIDGNAYTTLLIGTQTWTKENLRTTRYNDGSAIPLVVESDEWYALAGPGYCYYENTTNADTIRKLGALYNWHVVNTGKLAPPGWHVPDTADWKILESFLISNGYNWDGTKTGNKIGRSLAANTDWMPDTITGSVGNFPTKNNSSGFAALPAGCRARGGDFFSLGYDCYFWSTSDSGSYFAFDRDMFFNLDHLGIWPYSKKCGFSVRLVKD